jgi:hypothetical protein
MFHITNLFYASLSGVGQPKERTSQTTQSEQCVDAIIRANGIVENEENRLHVLDEQVEDIYL